VTLKNMSFSQGEYCMQIDIQTGDFNLDKYVFRKQATAIEKVETGNAIRIYADAQQLTVQSAAGDPIREITVYDVMGRLIAAQKINNQSLVTLDLPLGKSLLIVKVITEKANTTQKILKK